MFCWDARMTRRSYLEIQPKLEPHARIVNVEKCHTGAEH